MFQSTVLYNVAVQNKQENFEKYQLIRTVGPCETGFRAATGASGATGTAGAAERRNACRAAAPEAPHGRRGGRDGRHATAKPARKDAKTL